MPEGSESLSCHLLKSRTSTFFRIRSKTLSLATIPPMEGLKGLEVPLLKSKGLFGKAQGG